MDLVHRPDGDGGIERFARAWAREIVSGSTTALGLADVEPRLRALAGRLVGVLLAEPFQAAAATAIGAALVDDTFGAADALGGTLQVCGSRLLDDLGLDPADGYGPRLVRLEAALAHGYTAALRDRILAGQDSIHRAAQHASEARFRLIFSGAAMGIVISDADGRMVEVNEAFLRMLGLGPARVQGRRMDELVHPDDADAVRVAHAGQRAVGPEHLRLETRFVGVDGAPVWADVTTSRLTDQTGRGATQLSMIADVTARHLLQEQLRRQARHDPLTGLPNRLELQERLDELRASGSRRRIGVCFIDLDGFKSVNDSLGHDVGDRLLVSVAHRLSDALSPGHLLVRMGGDEFVVLITDSTGDADAVAAAESVLAALAVPLRVDDHVLSIGASIGVVERPVTDGDHADLLRAADLTLYRAKSEGRGRWVLFDAEDSTRGRRPAPRARLFRATAR